MRSTDHHVVVGGMNRMSPLDASFLQLERSSQQQHVGSALVFEGGAPGVRRVVRHHRRPAGRCATLSPAVSPGPARAGTAGVGGRRPFPSRLPHPAQLGAEQQLRPNQGR